MIDLEKTYTLDELVALAEAHPVGWLDQATVHLCTAVGMDPHGNLIGSFLCGRLCENDISGIKLWIILHLGHEGLFQGPPDLHELENAFRCSVLNRVPAQLIKDLD